MFRLAAAYVIAPIVFASLAVTAPARAEDDAEGDDPWGLPSEPAWAPPASPSGTARPSRPPQRWSREWPQEVSDPRAAVGGVLLVSGGLFVAGGASLFADAGPQVVGSSTICDATGCFSTSETVTDPSEQTPGIAMVAGGAATTLFGGALLANGFVEGKSVPHKSNARLTAGMVLTGYGVGVTVAASAAVMHSAIEGSDVSFVGMAMFVPALGLLTTGVPLWITGSRPVAKRKRWKDSDTGSAAAPGQQKEITRSPTMASIGLGMTALGLGVAGVGIGSAFEGERREDVEDEKRGGESNGGFVSSSDRPDMAVTILATVTAGVVLVSLGMPLAIIGLGDAKPSEAHASTPTDAPPLALPDISVGLGGATVTWRY